MLIYHSFCLCVRLGSCWTQVFWNGNDHMANTLKMNSACPASHVKCVLLMVLCFLFLFFSFFGQWKQSNCLCGSPVHCRDSLWPMLYATNRAWILYKGCAFTALLLLEVITPGKKKKKKKLCYCFNPNLIADCSRRPADDARRPSGSSRAVLECSWLRAGYWVSVRCDVQGCKQSVNDSQLPGDEGQEYWVLSTELWSTEEPPAGLGQAVLNSDRSVSAL